MWAIVTLDENADYGYGGEMYTSYEVSHGIGPFENFEEANARWRGMTDRTYERTFLIELTKP